MTRERKKALLRSLIDKVVLQRMAADRISIRIVWRGVETSEFEIEVAVYTHGVLSRGVEMEARLLDLARQGAYFGESAQAFRFKPPTVSVISPTLLMGLVGERRRDPWFSPYAGIAGRAKRHDDDEGSVDFWSAARTRRMDSPVSSIRSAR